MLLAGGGAVRAVLLTSAMACLQFSIGALNDLVDQDADAASKPRKPIPAGLVSYRTAAAVAFVGAMWGLVVSAAVGLGTLLIAVGGYGLGAVYDLGLKRTILAWLPFALALPLVPAYAWVGAGAGWPPRYPVLVALGLLAGPALALMNGLVDLERDRATGTRTLALRLGRARSLTLAAFLEAIIVGVAVATVLPLSIPPLAMAALAGSIVALGSGLALSAAGRPSLRELGWEVQAAGLGMLAAGWFAVQLAGV